MNLFLVFATLFFTALNSWAGIKVIGHGGGVFKCYDRSNNVQYIVPDIYENQARFGGQPDYDNLVDARYLDKGDYIGIALRLLDRFRKHNPMLAKTLKDRVFFFEDTVEIFEENFDVINDTNFIIKPPRNCQFIQVIVQGTLYPQSLVIYDRVAPYYLINGKVWRQLSVKQKATLVLHEVIYRLYLDTNTNENILSDNNKEAIERRLSLTSRSTRELVWFLVSDQINTFSTCQLWRWMYKNNFALWGETQLWPNQYFKISGLQSSSAHVYIPQFDEEGNLIDLLNNTKSVSNTCGLYVSLQNSTQPFQFSKYFRTTVLSSPKFLKILNDYQKKHFQVID